MNPTVHTAQVLPPRAVLFLGILAFHVVLAYLFASPLIKVAIRALDPPIQGTIIDVKPDPTPQPSPENPTLQPTTFITQVEPISDVINLPDEPVAESLLTGTISEPTPERGPEIASLTEPLLRFVGRNVMPNTEDYYPARDRRDGNEGTIEVRSCVSANGRLDGTPTVENSSGRASLDNAAVRVARDGRYAKAMRGETPVPNCYRFRVTFKMH
ncbi:MAG: TonB family protein [Gammaproteobacteria bacterium]